MTDTEISQAPDPADELADVFSIHHLVWLSRNGLVNDYPYALGPFPATLDFADTGRFDSRLKEDLQRWGVLTSDGQLNPDAEFLFNAILGSSEWMLWGTILLHSLKTNARAEFDPKKADDFGLKHAVRDVPRVTFTIAVTEQEIVTAMNAPPALIFGRAPRTGKVCEQVGEILKDMLDPEHNWSPWEGSQLTISAGNADAMAKNPETSKMVSEDAEQEDVEAQSEAIEAALTELDVPLHVSKEFADLMSVPTTASVQAVLDYASDRGRITTSLGIGVAFLDGKGVVVSYPVGKTARTRSLYYVPGDTKGFVDAVEALVDLARVEAGG
ncbi:MAG: hypothetical protein E6R04_03165 [Spirochaetes bacterium]|nr:MAG: hypothetical protein E6R04_03165 [Spirochaetota bacterium]